MKNIGIIGCGFSGIMTAVHIIEKASEPLELFLFDEPNLFGKGIAYTPNSKALLLNVPACNMSAFDNDSSHFVNWLKEKYSNQKDIESSFQPRYIYGEYLDAIWKESLQKANEKQIKLTFFFEKVIDIKLNNDGYTLVTDSKKQINVLKCVLAVGNQLPKKSFIPNQEFYRSKNYHQNPWSTEPFTNLKNLQSILILGNGLTMIDTVFTLFEKGFAGKIYTLSPNGFRLLPFPKDFVVNEKIEIKINSTLLELITMFKSLVQKYNSSYIATIVFFDSLRFKSNDIWSNFSRKDKIDFLSKINRFWNIGRHKIPNSMLSKFNDYVNSNQVIPLKGELINILEKNHSIEAEYIGFENCKLFVDSVINCSASENDLTKINGLLNSLIESKLVFQNENRLGLMLDKQNFRIHQNSSKTHDDLYAIGPFIKGEFWETTSVIEIRKQAEQIAHLLLEN